MDAPVRLVDTAARMTRRRRPQELSPRASTWRRPDGEPRRHRRSRDGRAGGGEGEAVARGDVEEPSAEERTEGAAQAAAALHHTEDRPEMRPREHVRRDGRELGNAHAKSEP